MLHNISLQSLIKIRVQHQMNIFKKTLISTIAAVATMMPAAAVPAKPGLLTVTQPDGSTLQIRLQGDERGHIVLSEDGYLLAVDKGTYYYADVDSAGAVTPSAIRATPAALRDGVARNYLSGVDMSRVYKKLDSARESARARSPRRGPGLFSGTHFPATGAQKAVVILVQYTDTKFNTAYDPHDYFHRMLNEPGFNDYGGTGSALDFFTESSMGQFTPQFDVFGPVTLSQKMSYYGGNDWYGNDQRPEEMIIEACQLLDDTVDFSEYDRDGDGYIDNVFVFYAGRGEASGGSADTVWPHSWDISAATSVPYYFDGVRLDRYACSNEWEGSRPDGVGTFVHEFSHVMGLPDLYATSYTGAFTPGGWSALDYGPYNNNGCTPPLYSAFERYALGWLDPLPIDGPLNATLRPIGTNQAGIIHTSSANEYFLVENRQQTSWDTYIPGHGMLVWHVDYNASVWASNKVNNTSSHQYVDIEEADGTQSESSRAGDAFPGTSRVTSFTDDTTPSMRTWSGARLGLPITDIAESADGIITFKVCGGREPLAATVATEPVDITPESVTATWKSAGPDATYVLSVYTRSQSRAGDITYVDGYRSRPVGKVTSHTVAGLEPETEYYYTVAVGDGWEESAASNEISFATTRLPLDRRAVTATAATDISAAGFTATWLPLADAHSYTLTVSTRVWGAPITETCDFADGVAALPQGWTSTTGGSYANAAYSGAAVPALRLGVTGDALTTPVYPGGIRTLSFWHRGNGSSAADRIDVSALCNGAWTVVEQIPVITNKGGTVTHIAEEQIPAGTTQLKLEFVRTGTRGAVAVDDVTVGYGQTSELIAVPGLTDYPAGSGTSCAVSGLDPATTYAYTVRAISADGTLISLPSDVITVTTAEDPNSGISDVAADTPDGPAVYYDLLGRPVAAPSSGIYIRVDSSGKATKVHVR